MNIEEAEQKAKEAYEVGLIEYEQIEAYIQHLLETRNIINKSVAHDVSTSDYSNI